MKKIVRVLLALLVIVVMLVTGVLAAGWWHVRQISTTPIAVNDPPLRLSDDPEALARGAHLFTTRGCSDCHGAGGRGQLVFDAGPVGRMIAPNLTAPGLAARGYDADAIAAAVRHGVRADGTPLLFMPAPDWHDMSDADVADLAGYVLQLPSDANEPGRGSLGPIGWVLTLFGKFPSYPAVTVDHTPRTRVAPEAAVTVEYGAYLVGTCRGCHGERLQGGIELEPGKPLSADLTPAALASWREEDFLLAMREGKRPDGRILDDMMPWKSLGKMSDTELRALWAYLSRRPAE